jgi:hypothetical protein
MAAKLTRLTHNIAVQLHLVAESYTICSSRSKRPARKLLDTLSYVQEVILGEKTAWEQEFEFMWVQYERCGGSPDAVSLLQNL